MNNKNEKTEKLFSAIGEIDDELLYEAQTYRKKRKIGHLGVLAACLALVIVIAIALPLINRLDGLNKGDRSVSHKGLDDVLLDCREGDYKKYSSFDELSYIGEAKLVWQYADSEEIYVLTISDDQLSRIESNMGKGKMTGERSPELYCKIWVLDGQGNVKTPYLESNAGNVGCQIFDYDAEIIPDESMVECISDIMN